MNRCMRDVKTSRTHLAIRADESVDLDDVDLVELLQGLLDLGLVGLDIYDELSSY